MILEADNWNGLFARFVLLKKLHDFIDAPAPSPAIG